MQADANRELVERIYREIINERNLDVIDELISDDFVLQRGDQGARS